MKKCRPDSAMTNSRGWEAGDRHVGGDQNFYAAATMPPPLLPPDPSAAVGSALQTTATVAGPPTVNTWSPARLGPTLGDDSRHPDHLDRFAPGAVPRTPACAGQPAAAQAVAGVSHTGIAHARREETYTGTPASTRPGRDAGSLGPTPMGGRSAPRHGRYGGYSPPESVSSGPRGRSREPPGYSHQRARSPETRPAASTGAIAEWSRSAPETARDSAHGSPTAASGAVTSSVRRSDASMPNSFAESERPGVPAEDTAESAVFAALRGFNPQRAEELQRKLRERQAAKQRDSQ